MMPRRMVVAKIVEVLLSKGASIAAVNQDHKTPLDLATLNHRTDAINLLKKKKHFIPRNIQPVSRNISKTARGRGTGPELEHFFSFFLFFFFRKGGLVSRMHMCVYCSFPSLLIYGKSYAASIIPLGATGTLFFLFFPALFPSCFSFTAFSSSHMVSTCPLCVQAVPNALLLTVMLYFFFF